MFSLDSLVACIDNPNKFKMYFTAKFTFVNYFENWRDSVMPTVNIDITEDAQTLHIALQDLTPKHIDAHLRDFIT